jgi:hypothetical protein
MMVKNEPLPFTCSSSFYLVNPLSYLAPVGSKSNPGNSKVDKVVRVGRHPCSESVPLNPAIQLLPQNLPHRPTLPLTLSLPQAEDACVFAVLGRRPITSSCILWPSARPRRVQPAPYLSTYQSTSGQCVSSSSEKLHLPLCCCQAIVGSQPVASWINESKDRCASQDNSSSLNLATSLALDICFVVKHLP